MDLSTDRIAKLSPEKRALLMLRLQQSAANHQEHQTIPKRENQNEFPMSYSQERMWFLHQLNPDRPLYNIAGAIRMQGKLNVVALHRSIQEIVRRHEVLRGRFVVEYDRPVQMIRSHLELPLPIIDLSHMPSVKREAELARLAGEEGKMPFRLDRDPLIRVKLLKVSDEDHTLLLMMHHIVSDGWSTQILFRELATCYAAFSKNQTPILPELPIQYADFGQWQRNWIAGEQLQSQLNYWTNQLQGMPRVLSLATDHPRPSLPSINGAHFVFPIPRDLSDKILQLSQQEGVTPFMMLMAAFQVLLYRYSGQEDFGIGTPVANRNRSEIETLIGCFVNTLVIRADLAGNPTYRELLHRVRQVTSGAYSHQDLPFETLVDALQPDRNISHAPLFQVMFDLQNASQLPTHLAELQLQIHEIETETAKFDLLLSMAETDRGFKAIFEYNTDLFEATTIERMATHFQMLLNEIVHNPDQRIGQLPILTPAEQHRMTIDWNSAVAELPAVPLIHRLFEHQVELNPEAMAVAFQQEELSYGQLNQRANQLAHYLRSLGVTQETIIGICLERSVEMVVAMMAVLKAGGAYLPLDPSFPAERLSFILHDAKATIVLTTSSTQLPMERSDIQMIRIDEQWPEISHYESQNLNIRLDPENLAYVIYTSGSTGKPKGVMISHRAAINLWVALEQRIYSQFGAQKLRVSLNAPIFFDASVQQFLMLLSGHALYLIPPEIRQNPEALVGYIRAKRLHGLDCVPSQLKLLIEAGLLNQEHWVPSIILPGGEAIDPTTWQTLIEADSVQSFNMYGPTECAVDSVICPIRAGMPRPVIGKPIPNVQVYIIDPFLNLVPIGVPGELCIAGMGLGRGYLGRPEMTAERFIPNPFSGQSGERLYRTGDLARYLPDGSIEFLGRMDYQVKIRGFRIELGEIEAALVKHPVIHDAVVMVREDNPGDKRLVAYVIAKPEGAVTQRELRAFLLQRLPDYMIPNTYVFLNTFPLNRSGKVDRLALPAPSPARGASAATLVPPRTHLEQQIANAFAQILHLEQISVFDNFFELGGDSIKAAVLTNQLQQLLDLPLNVRSIFLAPTVAEFAEQVRGLQPELKQPIQSQDVGLTIAPIEPISRQQPLPLSFGQQRLWFLDQFEPNSALYNMPVALHAKGQLNLTIMELAINEIIRRHEILRTIFRDSDGRAEQVILPSLTLKIPVIDLQHLPPSQQHIEAQRFANQESQIPFNLSTGPLIRAKLFQLRADEFILVFTLHHIIADGWSIGIMLREITALYEAFLDGEDSPLPDLTIQYADYAYWQRQWLQTDVLKDQLLYWKKQLANCNAMLQLPTDRPRPAYTSFRGDRHFIRIPDQLTSEFKQLCEQEQVTPFMGLMAVFQTLLSRYSNQTDICVGTPIANRPRAELEHLIGFFVNTLVIRTDLSNQPTFREVLQRVRKAAIDAYAHQDVPFEMLVDELQPQRDLSHAPLFQAMFVFQENFMNQVKLAGLQLSPYDVDTHTAKFDLTLVMWEAEGQFQGFFEYNLDLFESSTIDRFAGHFITLLQRAISQPEQPIDQLPLLTEAELQQVLIDWNRSEVDFPQHQTIHRMFEAQAARTPDAIAVVCAGQSLTYHQLNQRANQLARYLRKFQVSAEVPVGICVRRSLDMIVSMLGILKAGGAYLPLDSNYPDERLRFMLADAAAPVLLTQQAVLPKIPAYAGRIVCLDGEAEVIAQEDSSNLPSEINSDNLAYIIYTSGSTGKPKGVLLSHRGVINLSQAYARIFKLGPTSRVLQFFSYSFDGSVADIFMTLLSGASLHIVDEDNLLPGPGLLNFMKDQGITTAILPPSVLAVLPDEGLDQLEYLGSGGEATTRDIVMRWAQHREYFNVYGPTEATVVVSAYRTNDLPEHLASVPIGRPIDNCKLYILDSNLAPVPIGVVGELYISSVGLARGYLNRPDVTALKFIPDPFSQQPGARLYRSGDLARFLSDGNIEFLGRTDLQVKVRGFRIELGEIESALMEHPIVKEAVVESREDQTGKKRLVAYLTMKNGHVPLVSELREFLSNKLPDHMIPSGFMVLDSLPMTPTGKVDRKALPAPDQERPELESEFVAPTTPIEIKLAEIWRQVLGIDQVGIHDNFFELGGDSILSIQVIARANQAGMKLTAKQLFQAPTIAQLAERVTTIQPIRSEQAVAPTIAPLTPIQHWFFERKLTKPDHWNQAVLLLSNQRLDGHRLYLALGHVMQHHDALRLRFEPTKLGWRQIINSEPAPTPFMCADLSQVSAHDLTDAIEQLGAELQASLSLTKGPLIRVALLKMPTDQLDRLLIVIHHIAVDAVSWRILLEDLMTAYSQLGKGNKIHLPAPTTSYLSWAQKLSEYAQSNAVTKELQYWLSSDRSSVAPLPLDYPRNRSINTEGSASEVIVSLCKKDTQALLKEVPPVYGTEINDVLLTALVQTFSEWTNKRTLLIDLEGHGREEISEAIDLSRTVGWFTSIFPVLLCLERSVDPGEALVQVKETLRRIPNRGFGYGLLRYLNENHRLVEPLKHQPQPEVSFNYIGQLDQLRHHAMHIKLSNEPIGPHRHPSDQRTHLISISGSITNGRLQLSWSYSENHFRRETIEKLAQQYIRNLQKLIDHCMSSQTSYYTPSDFVEAELSQEELNDILSELQQT